MASIKDIALEVGVSAATVSLVLSNKYKNGRISKAVAQRVLDAAKSLNYHPNLIARGLKYGTTKSIGLVIADITNPFFAQLAFNIQQYMQKYGYAVLIMNTNEDVKQMGETINMLQNRQVDGYIIVPTKGGEEYVRSLIDQNSPLVLMDRYYESIETCNVLSDNFAAMYQCTTNLLKHGHKRICFISCNIDMIQIKERERGYREAMIDNKALSEQYIHIVDYDTPRDEMQQSIDKIFSDNTPYDVIIFAINRLATIGARMITEKGKEIGKDIMVVYFDKNLIFDLILHPMPHIIQPIDEIGTLTSQLLLEQINSSSTFKRESHLLSCSLVDF